MIDTLCMFLRAFAPSVSLRTAGRAVSARTDAVTQRSFLLKRASRLRSDNRARHPQTLVSERARHCHCEPSGARRRNPPRGREGCLPAIDMRLKRRSTAGQLRLLTCIPRCQGIASGAPRPRNDKSCSQQPSHHWPQIGIGYSLLPISRGRSTGNSTINVLPCPSRLSIQIWPPCNCTISRLRYKPRPNPSPRRPGDR